MRTDRKIARFTSSDKVLHLECPTSWGQLSKEQLHYTLDLIGSNLYNEVEIRTYLLFRVCETDFQNRYLFFQSFFGLFPE